MKYTKEEIGKILRNLRTNADMTQKDVAKKLGRTQQIIGHWETGYSQPDANTLFELCRIYGASVDEAFGFEPEKKEKPPEEIQWGDFSYALYKESPDLTEEDRDEILDVVRLMVQKKKERQQKEKSSE